MSEPANSSPVSGAAHTTSGGVAPTSGQAVPESSVNKNPEVQFNSAAIGTITARQEDPFKEHKARAAEKKQKNDKIRKRVLIGLAVILALLLIGLGVWWIICSLNQPVEEESGFLQDDTIKDIQTSANEIYNTDDDSDEPNIDGVVDYYEDQKNEATTTEDWYRITIAEMLFYAANSHPERVVETGDGIDPDDLPLDEALTYCNAMVNAWNSLGEPEKAEECDEFIKNNTVTDTNGVG